MISVRPFGRLMTIRLYGPLAMVSMISVKRPRPAWVRGLWMRRDAASSLHFMGGNVRARSRTDARHIATVLRGLSIILLRI